MEPSQVRQGIPEFHHISETLHSTLEFYQHPDVDEPYTLRKRGVTVNIPELFKWTFACTGTGEDSKDDCGRASKCSQYRQGVVRQGRYVDVAQTELKCQLFDRRMRAQEADCQYH